MKYIRYEINKLRENYKSLKDPENKEEYKKSKNHYKTCRNFYKTIMRLIIEQMSTLHRLNIFMNTINETDDDFVNETPEERRQFIMPCPLGDCKGFMSSGYKCGLCEGKICSKCHLQLHGKDEEHVCNKEMAESVKAINAETKPCPKCGTRISKINGCDQMWCIHCKTAFSWNTGKIVAGERIHNPEYFRWMRENNMEIPRVENQVECDRIPDMFQLERLHTLEICSEENSELLIKLLRIIIHIEDVEIPSLGISVNRDLRIKYLCDEVTYEEMTETLIKRERKNMKNTFLAGMYRLIVDVIADKLRLCGKLQQDIRYYDAKELLEQTGLSTSHEIVIQCIKEIICLCRYVNEQMENFTKLHGLKTLSFKENKNELFENANATIRQKRVYKKRVTY